MNTPIILIVDDEPEHRMAVRTVIEPRMECSIAEAGNGADAINYINNNVCDLLIIDIRMPEKNGLEVIDAVKEKKIPTIVVTAWDSEQVYKECRSRGVKDYVLKCDSLKIICDKAINELKKNGKYHPRS